MKSKPKRSSKKSMKPTAFWVMPISVSSMTLRRRAGLPSTGYPGFGYSQSDIFRDAFSNPATIEELNRMFQQAGLRFDQDFLNRTFFSGNGVIFQFYSGPGGTRQTVYRYGNGTGNIDGNVNGNLNNVSPEYLNSSAPARKPGFFERLEVKMVNMVHQIYLEDAFRVRVERQSRVLIYTRRLNYLRAKPLPAGKRRLL